VGCQEALLAEIAVGDGLPLLRSLFTRRGRAALDIARRSRVFAGRFAWLLNPVMELVSRQVAPRAIWQHAPTLVRDR
jgi:hypothetical protein